jgi:hypothetical protein
MMILFFISRKMKEIREREHDYFNDRFIGTGNLRLNPLVGLQVSRGPLLIITVNLLNIKTIPLPEGLPQPVERYYRVVYGDEIPVITSAVLTGHATLRPFGPVFLPARFRFTHLAEKTIAIILK